MTQTESAASEYTLFLQVRIIIVFFYKVSEPWLSYRSLSLRTETEKNSGLFFCAVNVFALKNIVTLCLFTLWLLKESKHDNRGFDNMEITLGTFWSRVENYFPY